MNANALSSRTARFWGIFSTRVVELRFLGDMGQNDFVSVAIFFFFQIPEELHRGCVSFHLGLVGRGCRCYE